MTIQKPSGATPPTDITPSRSDDELRRFAAERLAAHLDSGASLIARCEDLTRARRGDRLGPLLAAARLMRANAHVADALAHVAQVERRRRSIVERIQTPDPRLAELNSKKENIHEVRERLEGRILGIVERMKSEREVRWDPQHEAYLQAQQEWRDELDAP